MKKKIINIIPSIITIIGFCFGVTSIKYTIYNDYEAAISLILLATILDIIDGRMANLLNCSTKFGAQIDSLSDICNFGISPAILIYTWKLKKIQELGWLISLLYSVCTAIRLARFNTIDYENKKYFSGLPAPGAAILLITPIIIEYSPSSKIDSFSLIFFIIYTITISLLMISLIPIKSGKNIKISKKSISITLLILIVVHTYPWIMIKWTSILYGIFIIFSILKFLIKKYES